MDAENRTASPEPVDLSVLEQDPDYQPTGRQRSPRNDPSMRDGDSGRGNPYEYDQDEPEQSTDSDVGDEVDGFPEDLAAYAGSAGGAVGGTPAEKRAEGGTMPAGEPVAAGVDARDGSTIGIPDPAAPVATTTAPVAGDELPLPDYGNLSVPEIISRFGTMNREQLERVQQYESKHRKRKTLLTKLNRMLRPE